MRSPGLITPSVVSPGASTSMPTSRTNRSGGRLCLAKCPRIALVSFFSFTNSTKPICADSYPSRVWVLCCVITHGPACNTVAGRTSPFESKSCVMPTFLPRIPVTLAISFSVPSMVRRLAATIGWLCGAGGLAREKPAALRSAWTAKAVPPHLLMFLAERLNLHVHTRRQIKLHQRIDRLLRRLQNIQQPLVGADHKRFPRFLIHVRRPQHAVLVFHRGQRNRAGNLRPCALCSLHNLARRLIQNAVVVGFQPDANSFFPSHFSLSLPLPASPEGKIWRQVTSRFVGLLLLQSHLLPLTCLT